MATDPTDLIAQADAALEGVTPGPWKAPYETWDNGWSLETEGENSYTGVGAECSNESKILCIVGVDQAFGKDHILDANANFIAASRHLVPALRDALIAQDAVVAALEAENARLREALNWYEVQAAGARLIHSGGDSARANLAADGGARARVSLTGKGEE